MDVDTTLLAQFLAWIVSGGGAGIITYFVMDTWIPDSVTAEWKRYISLALAAAIAMAAFGAAVALGGIENPVTWQGWLESLFAVAFVATGLSQIIHGRKKLHEG
jgi:hypothetical protein